MSLPGQPSAVGTTTRSEPNPQPSALSLPHQSSRRQPNPRPRHCSPWHHSPTLSASPRRHHFNGSSRRHHHFASPTLSPSPTRHCCAESLRHHSPSPRHPIKVSPPQPSVLLPCSRALVGIKLHYWHFGSRRHHSISLGRSQWRRCDGGYMGAIQMPNVTLKPQITYPLIVAINCVCK